MESPTGGDATQLYARLLAEPGRPPAATGPDWDEPRLAAATAELLALGLLQPTAAGDPPGHAAVSVDTAVRQLLIDADEQVTALVGALHRARDSVDRLPGSNVLPSRSVANEEQSCS
ncbi:hypothetical protein ACWC5I_46750, partial [Kitasatospora sp. NPDC001574]